MSSVMARTPPSTAAELLAELPDRQIAEVAGEKVSYRSAGEGPTIIFLHGLLGSADSWAWQFHNLSNRCRVIAWDAPGYGESASAPQDIDAFADRLAGLIDVLEVKSPVVVGNSMGGTVAARLAARPATPVGHLVLSCSHAGYGEPRSAAPTQKLIDRIDTLRNEGGERYGQSRAAAMLAQPTDPFAVDLAARVAGQTLPDGLFDATRMLQFADLRDSYADIKVPTLVIFGDRDPVVKPQMSAELRALTPFAEHVTIPDTGHAPYLEQAAAFDAAIEAFAGPSILSPLPTS